MLNCKMFALVLFVMGNVALAAAVSCGPGKELLKSGGLTQEEIDGIIDYHNRLRQSVALGQIEGQPGAANMMEMFWDDELSRGAQKWSDNCTPAHDRASQRDLPRFPVGQNLAATWTTRRPLTPESSKPDFAKNIKAWFDEVKMYTYKPVIGVQGTGHYSQLIWHESYLVGCGYTFYHDPEKGYTKLYVCNYGPGGNVVGDNPYANGTTKCSDYDMTDSHKYKGLCIATTTTPSAPQTAGTLSTLGTVSTLGTISTLGTVRTVGTVGTHTNSYILNTIPGSTTHTSNGYDYRYFQEYNNQYQYTFKPLPNLFSFDATSIKALQDAAVKTYTQQAHTFLPVITPVYKPAPPLKLVPTLPKLSKTTRHIVPAQTTQKTTPHHNPPPHKGRAEPQRHTQRHNRYPFLGFHRRG